MKGLADPRSCALRLAVAALAAGLLAGSPNPAQAIELKGLLSARRALGVGFLGGALVLAKKGIDYRQQANDLYDRYKASNDEVEAPRLYQQTTNRDVKSQVSLALAAAFAVSGARLVLPREARPTEAPAIRLETRVDRRSLGLDLKRRFF